MASDPPHRTSYQQRTPHPPPHTVDGRGLESTSAAASASGRRSTFAIRSLFSRSFAVAGGALSGSSAATLPDLRRCKSFFCGRSCDVRGRSTLWALFHQDDRQAGGNDRLNAFLTARGVPKETSHVAKYNSNATAAYRDRIATLAEGKPWTDPPVVKETPDLARPPRLGSHPCMPPEAAAGGTTGTMIFGRT